MAVNLVAKVSLTFVKSKWGRKILMVLLGFILVIIVLVIMIVAWMIDVLNAYSLHEDKEYLEQKMEEIIEPSMQEFVIGIQSDMQRIEELCADDTDIDTDMIQSIYYIVGINKNLNDDELKEFVECFKSSSVEESYQKIKEKFGVDVQGYDSNLYEQVYFDVIIKYSQDIDTREFLEPDVKNNIDLANFVVQAYEKKWGYVWGTFGQILTQSLFDYKLQQYPDGVGKYSEFIEENWLDRRTADCIGLIKAYSWLDAETGEINYATNGMPDIDADYFYNSDAEKGSIDTIPEIPGLAVWGDGHIGVYIGNGEIIEAMGTQSGVVKTKVSERNFTHWIKIPFINYIDQEN